MLNKIIRIISLAVIVHSCTILAQQIALSSYNSHKALAVIATTALGTFAAKKTYECYIKDNRINWNQYAKGLAKGLGAAAAIEKLCQLKQIPYLSQIQLAGVACIAGGLITNILINKNNKSHQAGIILGTMAAYSTSPIIALYIATGTAIGFTGDYCLRLKKEQDLRKQKEARLQVALNRLSRERAENDIPVCVVCQDSASEPNINLGALSCCAGQFLCVACCTHINDCPTCKKPLNREPLIFPPHPMDKR